ncbi:MAG TPA: hypothetical protein VEK14_04665 [Rhodomicrobium sp.]|nr:hypothetical protein [Rhodomicrobium sp.]
MTYPLPEGAIFTADAVMRCGDYFGRREAWRGLCEAARKSAITVYVLVEDHKGRCSYAADPVQFAALQGLDPLDAGLERLLRTTNGADVRGRLFVFEADLEANNVCRPQGERPSPLRGRAPTYDWALIRDEALRLMDQNGEFDRDDPLGKWTGQACLERALLDYCDKTFEESPDGSTLRARDKMPAWLKEWRKRQPVGK